MIPPWKIRRELQRLWRQLVFVPMHPVEQAWFRLHPLLFPAAHDARDGTRPADNAVAVFVIFRPEGVDQTVLATCRHLCAAGYGVHLVSNAPLRPSEIEALAPLCERIIQRPNHGYDFGGYRQAILDIVRSGRSLSRLLLLNDSIWFPLRPDCDLLGRLQALDADLAGPVFYDHRTPHRAHLQSYMILFSARAIRSAAFGAFWAGYAMSSNKVRTIRNGEMRLTHACRQAGLTVAALRTAHEVPALDVLSPAERDRVVAYDQVRFAESRPDGRPGYILTNHPLVNFRLFDLPILKRDRAVQYRRQRAEILCPDATELRARIDPAVLGALGRTDQTQKIS